MQPLYSLQNLSIHQKQTFFIKLNQFIKDLQHIHSQIQCLNNFYHKLNVDKDKDKDKENNYYEYEYDYDQKTNKKQRFSHQNTFSSQIKDEIKKRIIKLTKQYSIMFFKKIYFTFKMLSKNQYFNQIVSNAEFKHITTLNHHPLSQNTKIMLQQLFNNYHFNLHQGERQNIIKNLQLQTFNKQKQVVHSLIKYSEACVETIYKQNTIQGSNLLYQFNDTYLQNNQEQSLHILNQLHQSQTQSIQFCSEKGICPFSNNKSINSHIFKNFDFLLKIKFILNFISQLKMVNEREIYFLNLKVQNTFFSFQNRKFKHFGLENSFLIKQNTQNQIFQNIFTNIPIPYTTTNQIEKFKTSFSKIYFISLTQKYFTCLEWKYFQPIFINYLKQKRNKSLVQRLQQFSYFQFTYSVLKLLSIENQPQFINTIKSLILKEKPKQFFIQKFSIELNLNTQTQKQIIHLLFLIIKNYFSTKNFRTRQNDQIVNDLKSKLIQSAINQSKKLYKSNNLSRKSQSSPNFKKKIVQQSIEIQINQNQKIRKVSTSTASQNSSLPEDLQKNSFSHTQLNSTLKFFLDQYKQIQNTFHNDLRQDEQRKSILNSKNSQIPLEIQKFQMFFQKQIQEIQNKSQANLTSYQTNQLNRTQTLNRQKALLKKDPVYGKNVNIEYHYYKNFLAIDFYEQGIKQIIIPALRSDLLLQLQYLSLGGIPIKAKGLQQLLKVQRPCLIALEVYCCQIQTLVDSNLQIQRNLQFVSISFNPFTQDTIDQLIKKQYPNIYLLKISFESFQLWQQFSKFIKISFPLLKQLYVRCDSQKLSKKFKDKKIFKHIDDLNYRFQRPPDISHGCVIKYDEDMMEIATQEKISLGKEERKKEIKKQYKQQCIAKSKQEKIKSNNL